MFVGCIIPWGRNEKHALQCCLEKLREGSWAGLGKQSFGGTSQGGNVDICTRPPLPSSSLVACIFVLRQGKNEENAPDYHQRLGGANNNMCILHCVYICVELILVLVLGQTL